MINRILSSFLLLLPAIALLGCPGGAAAQGVAPYIDMSITADENIVSIASASGLKAFTLAFLDADGACDIGWGGLGGALPSDNLADGTSILTVVQQLKAAGVTPIFSIGGADGVDPAAYCTSASSLQAVYQTAVTRYGITYLDFDIEGAATDEPAQITLRDQALVGLKSANPGLIISYTIPVLPTGLVAGDGLNLLTSAKSDGVALSVVNIMTMDYGSSGTEMGSAATEAAADTEAQIKAAGLSSTVGITPMIGQNDTGGEIFTLADATTVVNFAKANSYVSRLAYWSVGRDNGSCAGDTAASPSCSGISQSTYQFAGIFEGFSGSGGSGGGGTGGTGTTLTSGDTYTFSPQNAPALRLDDSGARTTTGNPIQVYTSNGTGAQNWTGSTSGVVPAGYWNFATEGAYCLTASGTASGSPAVLDPCIGSTAQAWEAVQSGSFYNLHPADDTALCLDVRNAGTASGTIVQVYTCNGTNAQNWTPTLN